MKNNLLLMVLVILLGICAGLGILAGINNAVSMAMAPLEQPLREIHGMQIDLSQKITTGDNEIKGRLTAIENKIKSIEDKLAAGVPSGGAAPSQPQPPSEDYDKVYDIPVGNSPVIGKKDAPVTIVQFTDLQCPFCHRFYAPMMAAYNENKDTTHVILKHFPLPFHPNAMPAAKVALAAAEQGKYQEMVEELLNNGADVSDAKVKEYAKKLGLNEKKLLDDIKNKDAAYAELIGKDMELATQVDVRGTPTFFINGKKTMARDEQGFKDAIKKALAEKK